MCWGVRGGAAAESLDALAHEQARLVIWDFRVKCRAALNLTLKMKSFYNSKHGTESLVHRKWAAHISQPHRHLHASQQNGWFICIGRNVGVRSCLPNESAIPAITRQAEAPCDNKTDRPHAYPSHVLGALPPQHVRKLKKQKQKKNRWVICLPSCCHLHVHATTSDVEA